MKKEKQKKKKYKNQTLLRFKPVSGPLKAIYSLCEQKNSSDSKTSYIKKYQKRLRLEYDALNI